MPLLRRSLLTLLAILVSSSLALAQADLRIVVGSVTVPPASTGNTFEVSVTNAGNVASAPLAAFSFGLSVPGASGITFTNASINTVANSYLFLGQSSTPPFSNDSFPNQMFTATDLYAATGGVAINPGQTFGLGLITFDVAIGATSPTTVTLLAFPSTSLSDDAANNVLFTGFNGAITLAVPEPGTWALMGIGAALISGWTYRQYVIRIAAVNAELKS